jgi:hypothetical protein
MAERRRIPEERGQAEQPTLTPLQKLILIDCSSGYKPGRAAEPVVNVEDAEW